ncbi:hypothetical protein ACFPZ0_13810 [Streptomonospora nanhaiensis]|uniref:Uncharacterized protein n=1 Tax=Streptomonospora nanhaiensis TaxID=1323731 RepID=A0A853BI11_9ACTN|nr:hypothetical protein [Streptomonospora nanhaiensis]MBV2363143.1 hypothetical protein [Streptomonospora nanhaiensis]MBX9389241.1 hypothetical protein [Streptomonospora nanhaiensis]NYI94364.1 hypothetical protein [Streptomonospora nanhaiensis]
MPPRPTQTATLRLAHTGRGNDISNASATQVDRPATGWATHPLTCHACGEQFTVEVCSLAELSTGVRRRRVLQGLAGLGAGAVLLVVSLLLAPVAVPASVIVAILGGMALVVAAVHLAITPYYQGIGPLRRVSDGRALHLPGLADHRVF